MGEWVGCYAAAAVVTPKPSTIEAKEPIRPMFASG